MTTVAAVPHDPGWRDAFEAQARNISAVPGENLVAIHHIGSTAIPGILAKPVIDGLVEVRNIRVVDAQGLAMEALGYGVMGEFGIPPRRSSKESERIRFTPSMLL